MAAQLVDLLIQQSMQVVGASSSTDDQIWETRLSDAHDEGSAADLVEESLEASAEAAPLDSEKAEETSTSHSSTDGNGVSEGDGDGDGDGDGVEGELTRRQRAVLDTLRVQTARNNHEYLRQHPEVRAMLMLLVREVVRQDRPALSVAGELFRSERRLVGAVRRMMHMTPSSPSPRRTSEEDDVVVSPVSPPASPDAGASPQRTKSPVRFKDYAPEAALDEAQAIARTSTVEAFDRCFDCSRRRATPVPWVTGECQIPKAAGEEGLKRRDSPAPWSLQEEACDLVWTVADKARLSAELTRLVEAAAARAADVASGRGGDGARQTVTRRDTPAPWTLSVAAAGVEGLITPDASSVVEEVEKLNMIAEEP